MPDGKRKPPWWFKKKELYAITKWKYFMDAYRLMSNELIYFLSATYGYGDKPWNCNQFKCAKKVPLIDSSNHFHYLQIKIDNFLFSSENHSPFLANVWSLVMAAKKPSALHVDNLHWHANIESSGINGILKFLCEKFVVDGLSHANGNDDFIEFSLIKLIVPCDLVAHQNNNSCDIITKHHNGHLFKCIRAKSIHSYPKTQ